MGIVEWAAFHGPVSMRTKLARKTESPRILTRLAADKDGEVSALASEKLQTTPLGTRLQLIANRAEQLGCCYSILKDRQQTEADRAIAAESLGDLGAVEYFQRLAGIMDQAEVPAKALAGAVFVAVAQVYGRLDLNDEKQKALQESFYEEHSVTGKKRDLFNDLLARNMARLIELKIVAMLKKWMGDGSISWGEKMYARLVAMEALGKIGEPDVLPALYRLIYNEDIKVSLAAIRLLGRIGNPDAVPSLQNKLGQVGGRDCLIISENLRKRAAAIEALVEIGPAAIPAFERDLEMGIDKDVIGALVKIGDPAAIPILQTLLKGEYKYAAAEAIERIEAKTAGA